MSKRSEAWSAESVKSIKHRNNKVADEHIKVGHHQEKTEQAQHVNNKISKNAEAWSVGSDDTETNGYYVNSYYHHRRKLIKKKMQSSTTTADCLINSNKGTCIMCC